MLNRDQWQSRLQLHTRLPVIIIPDSSGTFPERAELARAERKEDFIFLDLFMINTFYKRALEFLILTCLSSLNLKQLTIHHFTVY